ncbi:hypothetical protein Tco_0909545 [Tanacetum coccineum]|uniref:Ty3 transposon capsid-like protein domain-containing protein n=1 Tax=Tanacetum coccineum TaxID=301880 RepID=A0ABQ5CQG1_9ASTR
MEDGFYNLAVKGNDLKTYIKRFQELAILCPNMVPNTEKLMEVFISGLPKSIEGNVIASKPQTLEEATNIAYRLMDQIIRHAFVQEINDLKRKLKDKGNIINNNNYQNNYNNNNHNDDYHQQQNRRQETFRTYAATNGLASAAICKNRSVTHYYTEEDWDAIRAKLEANAELMKDVLGKDLPEQDFAKIMVDMLKKLKFEEIKKEFDKLVQQIDTFVPMDFEATKEKLKRYGEELQTKTSKKQKIDDKDVPAIGEKVVENAQGESETDKEESVEAMNPTSLATKSHSVKYGTDRPEDAYDRVLWSDLRTMFDPPLNEDAIWSLPLQQKMVSWRCLPSDAENEASRWKMNEVYNKLLKMIEKQAGI